MRKVKAIVAFFAIVPLGLGFAVPLNPELVENLKREGRLEEIVEMHKRARVRGVDQPNPNPPEWDFRKGKVEQPAVVILADFDDNMADTVAYPSLHYETMLFSVGTYPTGSMRDYYLETSYGKVDITGEVTVWLRMPEAYSYYVNNVYGFGSYPRNAQKLVEDAVLAADSLIDFSRFDADEDGWVDALFVVHAGPGAEVTGSPADIWSHQWVTHSALLVDGVQVYSYSMEPEDGKIGVFSHELGHVFGLPDLYDYDYDSQGVGYWSIMAAGSWGGGGAKPVHFDAWCKKALGFLTPINIVTYLKDAPIPQVETDTIAYRLWTEGTASNEYFLVENRRRTGFDEFIRGEGLLIYHVDEDVPNNDNQEHYKVAVEQADGDFDLEENVNSGDTGDPFPGSSNNRLFDATSIPNSNAYDGSETGVSVSDVSDADSMMTADLAAILWSPRIEAVSSSVVDSTGNDDGRADPGETVQLIIAVTNRWLDATEVQGLLSTDDSSIRLLQDSVAFPDVRRDEVVENSDSPFILEVDSSAQTHYVSFRLEIRAQPGDYMTEDSVRIMVGRPDILLVDDDEGDNYEIFYESALCSLGLLHDRWDHSVKGTIGEEILKYVAVIWFTGNDSISTLDTGDIADLSQFLDSGGSLLITGQNIGEDIGSTPFYSHYLHAQWSGTAEDKYFVEGLAGDEVGDGLSFIILGAGGASNQTSQDVLSPTVGADSVFVYATDGVAGVKYEGIYRVIYLGFGFEAINNRVPPGYSHRPEVLRRILTWFGMEVGLEETSEFMMPVWNELRVKPNPSEGALVVSYTLPNATMATLSLYDASGRLVKKLHDRYEGNGSYTRSYNLSLPCGVYFLQMKAGARRSSAKVIIVR